MRVSSAAPYVPDDEKEVALLDEDLDGEDSAQEGEEPANKLLCQDKDFLFKDRSESAGIHDSPNAVDISGQDLDSESHLSESSDRMSDFESSSLKNEDGILLSKDLSNELSPSSSSAMMVATNAAATDCSAAYDTLVELTVHMNETGHYRDDNHETDSEGAKRWSKPRKRSLLEMEGKEDAQKVLKCMYCGHSFESLQDLSVHMIKTKHYQKVPLKEPVTPVAAKIISSARKRAPVDLDLPSSPDSNGATTPKTTSFNDTNDILQKISNPYITPNNRYGHQNGASYAWQFESRKSQILKCMECGSSHDSLQELTAHMMVTGHFIKVTNSAIKKGKPIIESQAPTSNSTVEEKVQSVPLAATTFSSPPAPVPPPTSISPTAMVVEIKKEEKEEECTQESSINNANNHNKDNRRRTEAEEEAEEKFDISSKYTYLTEEDLDESPKGGLDILKSLENTVTSAINKAQNGAPSWGGYPSIHAAYQLPNIMKLSLGNSGKSSPLKYMFPGGEILSPTSKSQPLISPSSCQTSPLPKNNFQAMEELVKKVTEKVAKVEEKMRDPSMIVSDLPLRRTTPSPCISETEDLTRGDSPKKRSIAGDCKTPDNASVGETVSDGNGKKFKKISQ
ncbi:hypothetical protein CRENBAI_009772 [Crenichthys baileyi]|uniref:C2H2-type domain-containing protein n=1 Tax=Crenichthys baileyi TaxID=28760 RepID=A0AAV9R2L8_9TELE